MDPESHWQNIYAEKSPNSVSWFCAHDTPSLAILDTLQLTCTDPIIDIGGGSSTFVDDLLQRGFRDITVLDISATALDAARARLGPQSGTIKWVVGNVLDIDLPKRHYRLWRDRAVFHFLIEAKDRAAYLDQLKGSLVAGGDIIIATFASDGPERCSGLPVVRYDADDLHRELGKDFALMTSRKILHKTPAGNDQWFTYCHFRLSGGAHDERSV